MGERFVHTEEATGSSPVAPIIIQANDLISYPSPVYIRMEEAIMAEDLGIQRQHLVETLRNAGVHDEGVLHVIASIPREIYLDEAQRGLAYEDRALPIAMGQTISQPLMVATMTQALQLRGQERVLEIGTGSGYQTAILSHLAAQVYSIERYPQLAYQAAMRLSLFSVQNVSIYVADGSSGWPDQAPYDRIIVTAAAPEVPVQLLNQLVRWGILVIPVGGQERQELLVVHRAPWGPETRSLGACVFVPLIGAEGWSE